MPMRLAVLKERRPGEARVAATPETVKKFIALGCEVAVEQGAGLGSGFPDAEYAAAGAQVMPDAAATLAGAGIVLKVRAPLGAGEGAVDELALIPRGALLVGTLGADAQAAGTYASLGLDAASMELLPRITRAQSMDVLSSQANLAGYRAVIEAAAAFDRGFPMLMTAAGTDPGGDRLRHGRGRRGLAGHRHRATPGRARVPRRRAAGGQGGDQVARRRLHRPRGRGKPRRADRRRLRQADERRLPGQAGRKCGGPRSRSSTSMVCTALVQGPQGANAWLSAPMVERMKHALRDRGHRGRLRRQLRA
jgi:NAD(P) transhydrogenase subunit alpha